MIYYSDRIIIIGYILYHWLNLKVEKLILYYLFFLFSRENDITDIIDNTFTVEHESFGVLQMRELKPGGSSIVVTEDNKKEYVKLYVNYRFMQVGAVKYCPVR